MISTADNTRLQAINLAAEAEDRGVSVEQLALVNGVHSARVIALARELHTVLHEMHRELHRIGARQGFSPEQVEWFKAGSALNVVRRTLAEGRG